MVSYAEVKSYLSKREIPQLFESLMAGLMYHRPENHINYLQTCLGEIKTAGDPSNLQWSMFVTGKKRKSKELPPLTPKKQETVVWTDNSRQSTPLPPISAKSRCLHTRHADSGGHQNTLRSTYILYHNPPPVLAPPTVPVIFVLGGLGPKIDSLCEQVVSRLRGIVHISTCSMLRTRMTIEGFYRSTSVPACAVVDSVLQAMSMVQSSKSLIVAGFPRNRGDIEEYRSRQVRMDGVVLVDFEEEALRSFLHEEVKVGMIKMADLETELESYKQDLISVAEYYDEKDLLTVVMGDQDTEDVINDMVIAVDKIVETRSKLSVEESLAADYRSQRCRSNVSCRAIEASPTAETDQDNSETSNVVVDQPVHSDASSESGTGNLKETNLCLILIFGGTDVVSESVTTLTTGDYDMRYIEFSDLIKQAQCSDKSKCQTKQGAEDSTMGTDRALYLLKREMLKYLSSARVFVISGFPRTVEEARRFEKEIGLCDAAVDLTDLGDTQQQATADVLNYFEGKVKRISDIGLSVGVQISRIIQIILSEKKSSVVQVMSAEIIEPISDMSENIKSETKPDSPVESTAEPAKDSDVMSDTGKDNDVGEVKTQEINSDASNAKDKDVSENNNDASDEVSVQTKSGETEVGEVMLPQEEVKDNLEKSAGSEADQHTADERSASNAQIVMTSANDSAEEKVPVSSASDEKAEEPAAESEKGEGIASILEEKPKVAEVLVPRKPVLVRQETFSTVSQPSEKESDFEELERDKSEASDKNSHPENKEDETEPEKIEESKQDSDINHEDSEKENSQGKSVSEDGNILPSSANADVQGTPVSNAEDSAKEEEINKSEEQMLEAVEEQIIKSKVTEVQSEFKDPGSADMKGDKHSASNNSETPEDPAEKEKPSEKGDTEEAEEKQECCDEKNVGEGDASNEGENVDNNEDESCIGDKHSADGSDHNKKQEESAENLATPEKRSSLEACDDAPAIPDNVQKGETLFDEIKGSDTEDVEISDLVSDQQPLLEYESAEETDNVNTEGNAESSKQEAEDNTEVSKQETKEETTEIGEVQEDEDNKEDKTENVNGSNAAEQPEESKKGSSEADDAEKKEEESKPESENTAQDDQNSAEVEESQNTGGAENLSEGNPPDPGNSGNIGEGEPDESKTNEDEKNVDDAEAKTESQPDEREKSETSPDGQNDVSPEENLPEENFNREDGDDPDNSKHAEESDQPSVAGDPNVGGDGEGSSEKSDGNVAGDSANQENEDEDNAPDNPSEKDDESAQQQKDTAENEGINPESTTNQSPDGEEDKEQDEDPQKDVSEGDDAKQNETNDINKSENSDEGNVNSTKEVDDNSKAEDDEGKKEETTDDDDKKEEPAPTDDDEKEKSVPIDDDEREETAPVDDDEKEEVAPTDDDKKEETAPTDDDKKEETADTQTDDDPKERTENSSTDGGPNKETEASTADNDQKKETEINNEDIIAGEEQSESRVKKEDTPAEATAEESHSENSTLYLKSASVTDRYIRSGTSEHSDVRRNGNDLVTEGVDIASEQRDEEQQERSTSSSRGEL